MKPKTSPIWNYFVEINNSSAKCKICDNVYSRKGRTTTSLKSHLKSLHVEKFVEFEKMDKAVKVSLELRKQEDEESEVEQKYFESSSPEVEQKYFVITPPETDNNTVMPSNDQIKRRLTETSNSLSSHDVHSFSGQLQTKKKRADLFTATSVDVASNTLCSIANQEIFDNFGNLIASQLKSIPLDAALELQADVSDMVNRRLLAIHRANPSYSKAP